MTATTAPTAITQQPDTRSRLVVVLTIAAAWVGHGIITTAFAFGAPVGLTLLHRRCLYLASSPEEGQFR